jgi:hypothetical protein
VPETPKEPAVTLPIIQRSWIGRYAPDHEQAGALIERTSTCECGATFVQMQLSAAFLETMERKSPAIVEAFVRQTPGFWVPTHCPPCERKDITHLAHLAEIRQSGTASRTLPDRRAS